MSPRVLIAAALILAPLTALAQSEAPTPKVEVASIKRNLGGGGQYTLNHNRGGFRATNCPVSYMIMQAFGINDYQLIGGPSWISDRYDVSAKPGAATFAQGRLMLQTLLEDRFHLKAHREQREQTEYALTIAKGGHKLQEPKEARCPEGSSAGATPCGRLSWSSSQLAGRRAPMEMLTFVLSQQVRRKVVDETGLKGPFDMTLRWTPENAAAQATADAPPPLETALQEQMGLKLQPRKGLTDVVVVDHIERPTEN